MTLTAPDRRTGPQVVREAPAVGIALAQSAGRSVTATPAGFGLSWANRVVAGVLLVASVLLQRILLPSLPWGPADVVTVLVATLGIFGGPITGCLAGFSAGFIADALSDHALGRLAAALCIVGYLCGLVPAAGPGRFRYAWPTIALAGALTPLLFALTGAFVGDHRAFGALLLTRCVAGLCYGAILAPFAYLLLHLMTRPHRAGRWRSLRRTEL